MPYTRTLPLFLKTYKYFLGLLSGLGATPDSRPGSGSEIRWFAAVSNAFRYIVPATITATTTTERIALCRWSCVEAKRTFASTTASTRYSTGWAARHVHCVSPAFLFV